MSRVTGRRSFGPWIILLLPTAWGCMVGPNYAPPAAPVAPSWLEADQAGIRSEAAAAERWWTVFDDPVLDRLVDLAYRQNLALQGAGLRVLQAQARRAIAIGSLFPQRQALNADYRRVQQSLTTEVGSQIPRSFNSWLAGFDTVWELDLWGKFRRAIEASDADLLAAVADYDDVLVSLVAEVAATYVQIRVLDERLAVARRQRARPARQPGHRARFVSRPEVRRSSTCSRQPPSSRTPRRRFPNSASRPAKRWTRFACCSGSLRASSASGWRARRACRRCRRRLPRGSPQTC